MRLSRIGLGTWQFGSREWGYGERLRVDRRARAAPPGARARDHDDRHRRGVRPRAPERIIGETLAPLRPRCAQASPSPPSSRRSRPRSRSSRGRSAGRGGGLGMDALDLLYVHWKNPFVSARRVMQAMRPLVDDGLVRQAGVSNFTLAQWREAEAALRAPVVANQVQFSLAAPGPAEELVPYAEAAGRVVVAYSPLGQGVLAGRTDWSGPGSAGRRHAWPGAGTDSIRMQVVIRRVAEAHGATPAQVALAWVHLASQHGGDPRRPHDRAARGERGRRGPGAHRGGAGPAHGGLEGLRGTVRGGGRPAASVVTRLTRLPRVRGLAGADQGPPAVLRSGSRRLAPVRASRRSPSADEPTCAGPRRPGCSMTGP